MKESADDQKHNPMMAASVRDPKKEQSARLNWLMALGSFRTLAMFTRTRVDDLAIAELSELLMDESRWSRLADAIYEKPK